MKVRDLIEELRTVNQDAEVALLANPETGEFCIPDEIIIGLPSDPVDEDGEPVTEIDGLPADQIVMLFADELIETDDLDDDEDDIADEGEAD